MSSGNQQTNGLQTLDVRVSVPELADIGSFWMRDYPTQRTFEELYQDCVNQPDVLRSRQALAEISRHFWFGETMLRRDRKVAELTPRVTGATGSNSEISLILRRDYYYVGPPKYTAKDIDYVYVDAEAATSAVISQVLSKEERPCCFDLCANNNRRLAHSKSLAEYELFPAWEDAPRSEFPARAALSLRPRISWQTYLVYIATALCGVGLGFVLVHAFISPHGH